MQKRLEETHPHLKDFLAFLDHLNNESDRGRVLIAASMLDDLLQQIIRSILIPGKSTDRLTIGFNAPLGTFSSKIEIAFAMGVISEREYKDIVTIKNIRNKFAHNIAVSFDDNAIIDLCKNLYNSAKDYGDVVVGARAQFTTAATSVILHLTNRPHYVSKSRLTYQAWPY